MQREKLQISQMITQYMIEVLSGHFWNAEHVGNLALVKVIPQWY